MPRRHRLVVTGAAPLLGGHGADAAKKGKNRSKSAESGGGAELVQQFENTEQRIGIIDGAGPVVSSIEVSGFETTVTDVDFTLFSIFHGGNAGPDTNSSDDMDVLLVGPDGQSTLILSDVGGATTTNVSQLLLDDQASQSLPDTTALSSGTFRPTNFDSPDPIPGAPTPPSQASLGKDSFTYLAQDLGGLNAAATVDIQIKGKKHRKHKKH